MMDGIPCPCCLGKPGYKFDTVEGVYTSEPCTACKGSAVLLPIDNRTNPGGANDAYRHTNTEKEIMKRAPTARQALKELIIAGYVDRSYRSIRKWRTRNGIKRKDGR